MAASSLMSKKSTVVDFFGGDPPMGKPIHLVAQEFIQQIKTFRVPLRPVIDGNIFLDKCAHGLALVYDAC